MAEAAVTFSISFTRCIGPDGAQAAALPPGAADLNFLRRLYAGMVRARIFDTKAVSLQRTGRLGTYASSLGQEAVAAGAASGMRPDDVLVPSFREHGAIVARRNPGRAVSVLGGDERGSDFAGPSQDLPVSVPVGSHAPHAAGVVLAIKLRREKRGAMLCIFGDGATSKGDVAEALNIAGVWRWAVVFLICNNAWAISVPRRVMPLLRLEHFYLPDTDRIVAAAQRAMAFA